MRFTLRHSLAATAGAAALLGGTLLAPSLAGAQTTESFTVSPSTVVEGGTVTFTATGCVLDGVENPAVDIDLLDNLFAVDLPVDEEGTATFEVSLTDGYDLEPGSYTFTGYCYDPESEDGFAFEDQPVLDITAAPATTSTTSPTSTTAPPAAAAANVTPAFTG